MDNRFLTFKDYYSQIQKEDLLQILGQKRDDDWSCLLPSVTEILLDIEQAAQEEICSYIRNRYIVEEIFANTKLWSSGTTYFGKNLVYYTEADFSTGTTYNYGDRFVYNELIYECVVTGGTSGITPSLTATTPYNYIVENNAYFYANLPIAEFKQDVNYSEGNLVWYQDNIYQAIQNVIGKNPAQSQNLELRYGIPSVQGYTSVWGEIKLENNPVPTVNTQYWKLYNGPVSSWFTGTTYYFSGVQPTDTTYFTKGDNRNPQVKMYLIDIILYHLHSRINPRNIPELRNIRYDGNSPMQAGGAIGWLKSVEKGKVNLNCPEIIPSQGLNIRFGSYPKNSNFY